MNTHIAATTPAEFGKAVPLQGVMIANAAVKELYGTTEWVVDVKSLAARFAAQGFTSGLDDALAEVESRIERLNARA